MAIFNLTPASILSNVVSGVNLLNSIAKVDVVGVLDQNTMQQVFRDFRPVKAMVRESARVMDYPVETGSILSDHKVDNPTEIQLIGVINELYYASAYEAIRNAWKAATLLSVQTRTGTYLNMIIAEMPHEEDADMFNCVTQIIRLREVQLQVPSGEAGISNYKPRDPAQFSIVNRGLLAPITAAASAFGYYRALSVWGK